MLQTIKRLLLGIIDDIDAGNSNLDEDEALELVKVLRETARKDMPMSKYQAYTYLGVSRATFDNLVRDGKIPKGKKVPGFKEKMWEKKDLREILYERRAKK